jgi:hypothetical protein
MFFKRFVEKYEYITDNKQKQDFMHEIRHYFPGIVKMRQTKNDTKEYYIDGNTS